MNRNVHRISILALVIVGLLAVATQASAGGPQWPTPKKGFHCTFELNDGVSGTFNTIFQEVGAPHVFPDGNQLSRTFADNYNNPIQPDPVRTPGSGCFDRAIECDVKLNLAYKKGEIKQPPPGYGTIFEATLPDKNGQCKHYHVATEHILYWCRERHVAKDCVGSLANLKLQTCVSSTMPCPSP